MKWRCLTPAPQERPGNMIRTFNLFLTPSRVSPLVLAYFFLILSTGCNVEVQEKSAQNAQFQDPKQTELNPPSECKPTPTQECASDSVTQTQVEFPDSLGVPPIAKPEALSDEEIEAIIEDLRNGQRKISEYEKQLIQNALVRASASISAAKDLIAIANEEFKQIKLDRGQYILHGAGAVTISVALAGAPFLPNIPSVQNLFSSKIASLKETLVKREALRVAKKFGVERTQVIAQAMAYHAGQVDRVLMEGTEAWSKHLKVAVSELDAHTFKFYGKLSGGALRWGRRISFAGSVAGMVFLVRPQVIQLVGTYDEWKNTENKLRDADEELARAEATNKRLTGLFDVVETVPNQADEIPVEGK